MALDANGSGYEFVYDTTAGIPAVIEESTPGGVVYYIREPNGSLIARVAGSDIHYYHFDELGSTRLLTDGSGTVTDRYAYDAYGSLIAHDRYAGSIDQPYQYVGQLGYYTHHQEPEFGLLQLGVRFYDAEVGRFTQRDQAREHIADYDYCGASPITAVDPTGLFSQKNPNDRDIFDAYACYAACLIDLLGIPLDVGSLMNGEVQKQFERLVNLFAGRHCPRGVAREINEFINGVQPYIKLKWNGDTIRKICGWGLAITKLYDYISFGCCMYNCHKQHGLPWKPK